MIIELVGYFLYHCSIQIPQAKEWICFYSTRWNLSSKFPLSYRFTVLLTKLPALFCGYAELATTQRCVIMCPLTPLWASGPKR
jgi:hypothetical protein